MIFIWGTCQCFLIYQPSRTFCYDVRNILEWNNECLTSETASTLVVGTCMQRPPACRDHSCLCTAFTVYSYNNKSQFARRSSYLDNEWFTFETASTLVVGWEGGASRTATRQGDAVSQSDPIVQQLRQIDAYDMNPYLTNQPSGIEAAALASVGKKMFLLHNVIYYDHI